MATKPDYRKLSEAERNAPDLDDDGQFDVETYPLPDSSEIEDPYLARVWEAAGRLLDHGEVEDLDDSFPVEPSQAPRVKSGSWFGECPRDDEGHCKPKGEAEERSADVNNGQSSRSVGFSIIGNISIAGQKVNVVYDKEKTTQEAAARAIGWLDRIPKSELAKSTTKKIEIFENPEDVLAKLDEVGIDPDIGPDGVVRGAFDFDNGILYASTWDGHENSPRTLLHEFGHSILGPDEDAAESWAISYIEIVKTGSSPKTSKQERAEARTSRKRSAKRRHQAQHEARSERNRITNAIGEKIGELYGEAYGLQGDVLGNQKPGLYGSGRAAFFLHQAVEAVDPERLVDTPPEVRLDAFRNLRDRVTELAGRIGRTDASGYDEGQKEQHDEALKALREMARQAQAGSDAVAGYLLQRKRKFGAKSLQAPQIKAGAFQRKKDKLGRNYCVEEGRGRVPCPPGTYKEPEPGQREEKPQGTVKEPGVQPEAQIVPEKTPEQPLPAEAPSFLKETPLRRALQSSPVIGTKKLGGGANESVIVKLEGGGKGVFKPEEGEEPELREFIKGRYYAREAATADLAELLGLGDLVPTTVVREVDGRRGSVQNFIEQGESLFPPKVAKQADDSDKYDGEKDLARAAALDYLIGNSDRHLGNWMIKWESDGRYEGRSGRWKLVLIDNGLSFPDRNDESWGNCLFMNRAKDRYLKIPEDVRKWWNNWPEIKGVLQGHGMDDAEIGAAKERLDQLVSAENFRGLFEMSKRGEAWWPEY